MSGNSSCDPLSQYVHEWLPRVNYGRHPDVDSVEPIDNKPTSYLPVIAEYVRFKLTEYVVSG
jgi:hypothetical protein